MRVIHLLQSNRFSGAENVVCQIIKMLQYDKSIEMMYCSRDGQIREALSERGIEFIPIRDITVREVKRVIKEYKPNIIHAHDMCASFIAARACGSISLISHIHNNNFDSRALSKKSIAYLLAGIKSKHIFWVSDSSYNGYVFHNYLKKKSEVLYNMINIDELYRKMSLDEKSYNYDIVYLGRLSEPKNPIRMVGIFQDIVKYNSDVKIAIIGTGELEKETCDEIKNRNLEKYIDFFGFISNPYKILHDSKLMIMTSLWEGTPMCVLEAMSLGVPVVSTPTDGVKVVVKDGETGILSDKDEELVGACINIIENREKQKQMSELSKQRAREIMDIERYKNQIIKAYNDCMIQIKG